MNVPYDWEHDVKMTGKYCGKIFFDVRNISSNGRYIAWNRGICRTYYTDILTLNHSKVIWRHIFTSVFGMLSTRENPEVLIKEQLKLSQSLVFKELTFVSEPESEGLVSEEGRKKKKWRKKKKKKKKKLDIKLKKRKRRRKKTVGIDFSDLTSSLAITGTPPSCTRGTTGAASGISAPSTWTSLFWCWFQMCVRSAEIAGNVVGHNGQANRPLMSPSSCARVNLSQCLLSSLSSAPCTQDGTVISPSFWWSSWWYLSFFLGISSWQVLHFTRSSMTQTR